VYNATGSDAPDVDDPAKLKGLFDAVQKLNRDGLLLAYHDRSDGGLFVAACEMAFASRRGVSLDLDGICFDAVQRSMSMAPRSARTCWPAAISKTSCAPCSTRNSAP
jgi:phosphoribosylformylglycinamidine (FGAM) synthase-like enzyme